jgi:hypothetical protein
MNYSQLHFGADGCWGNLSDKITDASVGLYVRGYNSTMRLEREKYVFMQSRVVSS